MNSFLVQQTYTQRYATFLQEAHSRRVLVRLFRERPVSQRAESAIATLVFRVGFWLRINLAASFS